VVRVDVRAVLLGDVDDCLDLEILRERALDLRPIHIDGEGDLGPLLAVASVRHVGEMGPLLSPFSVYSVWFFSVDLKCGSKEGAKVWVWGAAEEGAADYQDEERVGLGKVCREARLLFECRSGIGRESPEDRCDARRGEPWRPRLLTPSGSLLGSDLKLGSKAWI
jgi:hypothetical protein